MEKKLENYCTKLAVLLHSRYYICNYDIDIRVVEVIDDSVLKVFKEMYKDLEVDRNCSVFRHFFWSKMKQSTEWRYAVNVFGKDFDGTIDYINEILDRPYEYD